MDTIKPSDGTIKGQAAHGLEEVRRRGGPLAGVQRQADLAARTLKEARKAAQADLGKLNEEYNDGRAAMDLQVQKVRPIPPRPNSIWTGLKAGETADLIRRL